jgi:probable HAF family extracellular repeat protein
LTINDSGQVAGEANADNGYRHAFLYDGTTMKDIGRLARTTKCSFAYGINNNGNVVGCYDYQWGSTYYDHAFLYDGTRIKDIGTLGGNASIAYGINDNGIVIGTSSINGNSYKHAFLYDT